MKADNAFERVILAIVRRVSERGVLVLALVCYAGLGLLLPLAAGWPISWFVAANVFGAMLAMIFLIVWMAEQVLRGRRRNLLEWTTDLRHLDAEEFEWFVGELLRREGWTVTETGRPDGPDGGIDLIVARGKERKAVQCKRWTSWRVGVEDIRSFAGALTRDGLRASDGIFVTLSDFGEPAIADAKKLGLTLVDGVDLYARAEAVRRPDPCPVCGSPMLLDRSPRGWWFRCLTTGCVGKRDLGRDPAQAVDLLTEPPGM